MSRDYEANPLKIKITLEVDAYGEIPGLARKIVSFIKDEELKEQLLLLVADRFDNESGHGFSGLDVSVK